MGTTLKCADGTSISVLCKTDALSRLNEKQLLATLVCQQSAAAAALLVNQEPTFYRDENGNLLTVKRASVTLANNTANNAVVGIVAAKKIRVLQLVLTPGGTGVTVTFRSKPAGAGTDLAPALGLVASVTLSLPRNNLGYYETVAGEALTATTSNGSAVAAQVYYVEVA